MPFMKSRSRFGKHRYTRRTNAASLIQRKYRKHRRDRVKTASTVKKIVRNMEQMSYQQYNITPSISTTPSILTNFTNITYKNETNNPPDRDGLTQRTTQKVFLSSIRLSGHISYSDDNNRVRLMMCRAKRSDQTANPYAADATQVFNDVDTPGGSWLYAPVNYRTVQVLWDWSFSLQEQQAGSVHPPDKYFKKVFVLKKNLRYNLKETDNSDFPVNDYTYFLVGVSDSSITPHPAGRIQCTVSFKNVGT